MSKQVTDSRLGLDYSKMAFTIEDITPELAKEYLKASYDKQRVVKPSVVARYAAEMTGNRWGFTPQAITFEDSGALIDGQHRLQAIIKSGQPVRFLVIRNWPSGIFAYLDKGRKRSIGDSYGVSEDVASVVGIVLRLMDSTPDVPHEPQPWIDLFAPVMDALLRDAPLKRKILSSAPMRLAAALRALTSNDPDMIYSQYLALIQQNYDAMTEASKALNRQVIQCDTMNREELLCRAYLAFDTNASHKRVRLQNASAILTDIRAELKAAITKEQSPMQLELQPQAKTKAAIARTIGGGGHAIAISH